MYQKYQKLLYLHDMEEREKFHFRRGIIILVDMLKLRGYITQEIFPHKMVDVPKIQSFLSEYLIRIFAGLRYIAVGN
jgi:hypothetical protein